MTGDQFNACGRSFTRCWNPSEVIRVKVTKVLMKVDSENVHIPELKKFIGKTVEMIITEVKPKNRRMDNFFEAAGKVKIDKEAVRKLREASKL